MTTPLLIGNSPAIELRNIMKYFVKGARARFDGFEGNIEFVGDEYVTLCISKNETEDEHAFSRVNKCCIVIYPHQWEDVEMEPIKQYGKSYTGVVDDHPGNDMLPELDKR